MQLANNGFVKKLKKSACLRTAVCLVLASTTFFGSAFALAPVAQAATLDGNEADLLVQINAFRSSRGLVAVVPSDRLTSAAKWMATDMAVNSYFSHTSLDGRSPFQRMSDSGYPVNSSYTGENLAAGQTTGSTVVAAWLNSPAHLAVLTNPNYKVVGIGRAYSAASTYGTYWAADFGSSNDAGVAVTQSFDTGYHATWSRQSANLTLSPGQTGNLVLALKNTGYRGWYAGNLGQEARIGTSNPIDSTSVLASGWFAPNRPASQSTTYVGPGQEGWFTFNVKAPLQPGVYKVYVRGVIDGSTWLEDNGISWTITVR